MNHKGNYNHGWFCIPEKGFERKGILLWGEEGERKQSRSQPQFVGRGPIMRCVTAGFILWVAESWAPVHRAYPSPRGERKSHESAARAPPGWRMASRDVVVAGLHCYSFPVFSPEITCLHMHHPVYTNHRRSINFGYENRKEMSAFPCINMSDVGLEFSSRRRITVDVGVCVTVFRRQICERSLRGKFGAHTNLSRENI